tara:strand:- start:2897 stop:3034 length:138 start_codon:yes stop_codon:yes gene_type:complete
MFVSPYIKITIKIIKSATPDAIFHSVLSANHKSKIFFAAVYALII